MRIDISQLMFIDAKLRTIAVGVEIYYGMEFTVTSLYRMNDSGVHGQLPLRGLDFRCPNKEVGWAIEEHVNSIWEYDHTRPDMKCCIFHDAGTGNHLHLQVHPNTRRRLL